ncbi:MAG: 2Fe-2S iron-sulfur cluster binding domain-containing protein [Cyanobacteria bacterium P01_E01_bin.42]
MANSYTVEIHHGDTTQTLSVAEDQTILDVALENGVDLPNSCCAGVCTTCAAKILEGKVEQDVMGLSPDLQAEGYALLCYAYPRSDLKLESSKEDEVYARQFQSA